MQVTLTPSEVYHAACIGVNRRVESLRQGLKCNLGNMPGTRGPWEIDVEGSCAELAAANALGLFWPARVNTFKSLPDIDPWIEVRSGRTGGKKLIVRPGDNSKSAFVLVVGAAPKYDVLGWMWGSDAKKKKYLDDCNNGRPAAYFVPMEDLCPLEDLMKRIGLSKQT